MLLGGSWRTLRESTQTQWEHAISTHRKFPGPGIKPTTFSWKATAFCNCVARELWKNKLINHSRQELQYNLGFRIKVHQTITSQVMWNLSSALGQSPDGAVSSNSATLGNHWVVQPSNSKLYSLQATGMSLLPLTLAWCLSCRMQLEGVCHGAKAGYSVDQSPIHGIAT